MNKRRLLIVSCSIILLCMISIIGMTFALFTSSVRVQNHLVAGSLDVELIRTKLEYKILGADGKLHVLTNNDTVNFSEDDPNRPEVGIFGIASNTPEMKLVPGSYFEATLTLTSDSSCAYDYGFSFVFYAGKSGEDLAEQMFVTITPAGGTESEPICLAKLTEGEPGSTIEGGHMTPGSTNQTFKIKVSFEDFREGNASGLDNNDAMNQEVYFDVIVEAVQATQATE